ncbi:MAG TPA: hypothetical protein PKA02_02435 [Candidatus Saccharibacteria bacterium]|nr:hypothetical protein [Candidatus Saccharibacteria bacterium]
MSGVSEIGLYTTPSTWVSPFAGDLSKPYRRVVGVQYGDGVPSVDWAQVDPVNTISAYDRTDADLEVITMPTNTARLLIGFYKRFFVNSPQTRPQYSRGDGYYQGEQTEEYNCHRFGYWMQGTPAAQKFECPEAPDHITERRPAHTPLPLGRHGVLGTVGAAVHSIVGLGEDREDCLQVLATGGHMGIDTYEAIVDQYDYMRTAGMQYFA